MSDVERLKNIGFQMIGVWKEDTRSSDRLSYGLQEFPSSIRAMLRVDSALYAFVQDEEIKYIGKTARSIEKRFIGYCNPGNGRATNYRCHTNIKKALSETVQTHILVLTPLSQLNYGEFQIDLAAGLEEALIREFDPPWNGRSANSGGKAISEDAERELKEDKNTTIDPDKEETLSRMDSSNPPDTFSGKVKFRIKLGKTYYNKGFINPGIEVSNSLGGNGELVRIFLGEWGNYVDSVVNRNANGNNSPRFIGGNNEIAHWFQNHYAEGDIVEVSIIDKNSVFLHEK